MSLALGLDAGGTQTRWALMDGDGLVRATGAVGGLSAVQMNDEAGRAAVARRGTDEWRLVAPAFGRLLQSLRATG